MGLHVMGMSLYYGLVHHRGTPSTRAEQKAAEKITDSTIKAARQPTEQRMAEWEWALSSRERFGKLMGFAHIFGEPPDEPPRPKTKADYKKIDEEASAKVIDFLEQFEKRRGEPGGVPSGDGPQGPP